MADGISSVDVTGDWVFGYGSIMNNTSRARTAGTAGNAGASPTSANSAASRPRVVLARLQASFGLVRCWNFRSATGFTAAGLRERSASEPEVGMCGVIFDVCDSMAAFDEREKGYERRRIHPQQLEVADAMPGDEAQSLLVEALRAALRSTSHDSGSGAQLRLWIYVPLPSSRKMPSEDFPICQTYIDTVLQGCLAWGGSALAREWVTSTFDWSTFFLNDAPLSRRPWLHRERHAEIDEVLAQHSEWTRFAERRHPEDFASHWMAGLRGMWGVPPRNHDFVGREKELCRLRDAMQSAGHTSGRAGGVVTVDTSGLGGVGKTQIATEYCYRHYQATADECGYGLVVWLRAESSDSIAAGFRELAADSGLAVRDMHNEEIIDKIRSRLYRTGCPWLLVFDNVEAWDVLSAYMPRGGFVAGHVLITSRCSLAGVPPDCRVQVDCFSSEESVDFLVRAAGSHAMQGIPEIASAQASRNSRGPLPGPSAAHVLADALGHLPLALAMAAAYMAHCDVTCVEYCEMLRSSGSNAMPRIDAQKLAGYPMGIRESLSLSLRRMDQDEGLTQVKQGGCVPAQSVLNCLGFLAPDGITKPLVRLLVRELQSADLLASTCSSRLIGCVVQRLCGSHRHFSPDAFLVGSLLFAMCIFYLRAHTRSRVWWKHRAPFVAALLSLAGAGAWRRFVSSSVASASKDDAHEVSGLQARPRSTDAIHSDAITPSRQRKAKRLSGEVPCDMNESSSREADRIWTLVKQYSLLTVRDRMGSMHRLLQQLLREAQGEEQAAWSLVCCMRALRSLWAFDPADTTTWAEAGRMLEHVKAAGRHVDGLLTGSRSGHLSDFRLIACCTTADLLTESALYMSMALSRFEEANDVLDMAMRLLNLRGKSSMVDADLARALHTQGQVARYRGKLQEASLHLENALEIRRRLSRRAEAHQWDVAASLHELGVLRLKQHLLEPADQLLRESLKMKRALRVRAVAPSHARLHRFADESATLHQLAVAAMQARPSRLDEAEALLREALALETAGNPFGRGARAASLQQLARVEIRRGHLEAAQGHLQDALALHREAYGQDTPHVNIVAVMTQLGKVACAMGLKTRGGCANALFAEAAGHLLEALGAQQRIYGVGSASTADCDHPEIAATLGQLGVVERARKALPAAQRYFAMQQDMLLRLLPSGWEAHFTQDGHVCKEGPVDAPTELLLRQLLSVNQWGRIVAKEIGEPEHAKTFTVSIKRIEKMLSFEPPRAADPTERQTELELQADAELLESPLCRACVTIRDSVRKALITARKTGSVLSQEVLDMASKDLMSFLMQNDADQRSGTGHSRRAQLRDAATAFCQGLQSSTTDKFAVCDALRAALRDLGVANLN